MGVSKPFVYKLVRQMSEELGKRFYHILQPEGEELPKGQKRFQDQKRSCEVGTKTMANWDIELAMQTKPCYNLFVVTENARMKIYNLYGTSMQLAVNDNEAAITAVTKPQSPQWQSHYHYSGFKAACHICSLC